MKDKTGRLASSLTAGLPRSRSIYLPYAEEDGAANDEAAHYDQTTGNRDGLWIELGWILLLLDRFDDRDDDLGR